MKLNKKIITLLFILSFTLILSACGSFEGVEDNIMTMDGYSDSLQPVALNSKSIESKEATSELYIEEEGLQKQNNYNQKLIKTVYLDFQTETFKESIDRIEKEVLKYGGYIESSQTYSGNYYDDSLMNANYTIRIPSDKLDLFLSTSDEIGTITNKSNYIDDITLLYSDTENRKNTLEIEMETLNRLLLEASDIEQVIILEERLSNVRYELSNIESSLKIMDNQVDYSTIYITLEEVKFEEKIDESISSRITNNWKNNKLFLTNFFKTLFILMTSNLLFIIFEILLIIAIVIFVKKKRFKIKDIIDKETNQKK